MDAQSIIQALRDRARKFTSLNTPQDADLGDVAIDIGAGFLPGVGTASSARDFERARREGDALGMGLAGVGMIPFVGGVTKGISALRKGANAGEETIKALRKPPRAEALEVARQNAVKIGQSPDALPRMLQQGYEDGWYHGTTGDIRRFDNGLLGEATGAQSAKKAHFFARDPQNPPAHMTVKAEPNSDSVKMLRKIGIPESEIQKLNTVSMQGHGAETASGYAQIGGSREYREAMRKSAAAEKSGNWDEYEKWMQVAEDAEIGRNQQLQSLVAKYGEARDTMLDSVNSAIYSKQLPQAEAEALDRQVKQLMPYGWYNSYSIPQMQALKSHIASMSENPQSALKAIDDFISVKAERQLAEHTQEGGNVMPVALRYKNPLVHDFGGSAYRDQSYSDLLDKAIAGGHDAVLMKNTFDPGAGPAKLVDIAAIFNPAQVRSRFAAFDPARVNENDLLGRASPALLGTIAAGTATGLTVNALRNRQKEKEDQR